MTTRASCRDLEEEFGGDVEAAAEAFDAVLVEFAPRRSARGEKIALRRTVRSAKCALAA